MTKYEWETELKKNIHRLPDDEIKRVLEYYGELFEDNIERGKTESAIIGEFGNPVDVAHRILSEYDGELNDVDVFDTPPPRRDKNPIYSDASAASSPHADTPIVNASDGAATAVKSEVSKRQMALAAFIIVNIVTGFAPMILAFAAWIVLGALTVAGVAAAVGGVAAVIVSVGQLFTGASSGLAQLGVSIAAAGAGLAIALLVIQLMKLYGRATAKCFKLLTEKE